MTPQTKKDLIRWQDLVPSEPVGVFKRSMTCAVNSTLPKNQFQCFNGFEVKSGHA